MRQFRPAAQFSKKFQAVHPGHVQIQQNKAGIAAWGIVQHLQLLQRFQPVSADAHRVAHTKFAHSPLYRSDADVIVVNDEQCYLLRLFHCA